MKKILNNYDLRHLSINDAKKWVGKTVQVTLTENSRFLEWCEKVFETKLINIRIGGFSGELNAGWKIQKPNSRIDTLSYEDIEVITILND